MVDGVKGCCLVKVDEAVEASRVCSKEEVTLVTLDSFHCYALEKKTERNKESYSKRGEGYK